MVVLPGVGLGNVVITCPGIAASRIIVARQARQAGSGR
jgi:hypothetical protein